MRSEDTNHLKYDPEYCKPRSSLRRNQKVITGAVSFLSSAKYFLQPEIDLSRQLTYSSIVGRVDLEFLKRIHDGFQLLVLQRDFLLNLST